MNDSIFWPRMRAFIFSPQRVLWRRFVKRQKLKKERKKVGSEERMFSARNQIRWFEEEWRRANEREVEEVEKVEKIEEPVLQVVAKVSEPVVAEVDEEGAKVAENHAKHLENLRKYFARTTESTTMAIPVHRQKATR